MSRAKPVGGGEFDVSGSDVISVSDASGADFNTCGLDCEGVGCFEQEETEIAECRYLYSLC